MIKPILNIADMCHKCPWFESEIEENKLYADDMYTDIDIHIHIFCKHKNLCDHIKSFLKDELTPEEPNTCEPDDDKKCNSSWEDSDDD